MISNISMLIKPNLCKGEVKCKTTYKSMPSYIKILFLAHLSRKLQGSN